MTVSREHIEDALRQYAQRFTMGDREGWLSLFVEQPVIIEPADAAPHTGRQTLERAFDGTREAGVTVRLEPCFVVANGNEGAMHMRTHLTMPDGSVMESSVIEIFTFAADGRIERMRAFLQPGLLAAGDS